MKREPTESHLVRGSFRADRHGDRTVDLQAALPDPPAWLNEAARQHWHELGPKLVEAGLLVPAFQITFALLCTTLAELIEVKQLAAAQPSIAFGKVHPLRRFEGQLAERLLMICKQFGMTPASIGRVTRARQPTIENPLNRFKLHP